MIDQGASSEWLLIKAEDVAEIANALLDVSDNEDLPIQVREAAMTALHTLDTGAHDTAAVPSDFQAQ